MTEPRDPPVHARVLRENGPTAYDDFHDDRNGDSPSFRVRHEYDIRKMAPKIRGRSYSNLGQLRTVYYLGGVHDLDAVVRAWLDANEGRLATLDDDDDSGFCKSITEQLSGDLKDAWRTVARMDDRVPETPDRSHDDMDNQFEGECPFCGARINTSIAHHLRHECDEN